MVSHYPRLTKRVAIHALVALLLGLMATPLAAAPPSQDAAQTEQPQRIYGVEGTLRPSNSSRFQLELVSNRQVFVVVGQNATLERQMQRVAAQNPPVPVKIWGALSVDPVSGRRQLVVDEMLVLAEQDGNRVFVPFAGSPFSAPSPTSIPPAPTPIPLPTSPPSPDPQRDAWRATYYPNTTLAGDPALVTAPNAVDFDWGDGSPGPGVPADSFSARFERTIEPVSGRYRFTVQADDGVRVYLDNELVVNEWHLAQPSSYRFSRPIQGPVTVRIEYYEAGGQAAVRFDYQLLDDFPDWKASYFDNINLDGGPDWVRPEPRGEQVALQHTWSLGSPVPGEIPTDNWSGRWEGTFVFEGGNYVFWLRADDGARLYLDDIPVVDAWERGGFSEQIFYGVGPGEHTVRIEFYEQGGIARLSADWYTANDRRLTE